MPVPKEEMKKADAEEARKGEPSGEEKATMAAVTLGVWNNTYNDEVDRLLNERAEKKNNFTDKEISDMAEAKAVEDHGERPVGGRRRKSKKTRKSRKASKKSRKTRRRA